MQFSTKQKTLTLRNRSFIGSWLERYTKIRKFHAAREDIKSARLPNVSLLTSVVEHLNLDDRLVTVSHGGSDGDSVACMIQAATFGLTSDKAFFFIVIHLFIEIVVTLFAHVKHSHCKPVRVQVKVIGIREHDGHFSPVLFAGVMVEIVGEHSNRSTGCVRSFDEQSAARAGNTDDSRQRFLTGAALSVDPGGHQRVVT